MKQPIQISDLYLHDLPVGLTATRSGHAVWSQKRIRDQAPRKPIAHLVFAAVGSEPRPLTQSGSWVDAGAVISPDGQTVAFVRSHVSDEPEARELRVVAISGGASRVLAREKGDFAGLCFSPDSKTIAFSFRRADPIPEGAKAPLSIRVNRAFYKLDGYGFLPQDRERICTVAADATEPRPIVPLDLGDPRGAWDDNEPTFSPDGTSIAFLSNRRADADLNPDNRDLFVAPSGGGEARCCTRELGPLMKPAWAPSGAWIAAIGCLGPPGTMLMRGQAGLISIDPSADRGERTLSADFDQSLMNLTIDDLWGLDDWAQRPVFIDGGDRVLVPVSQRGTTWLAAFEVDADGSKCSSPSPVIDDRTVVAFSGGETICALTSSPTEPGVLIRKVIGSEADIIASPLAGYLAERQIAEPIEFVAKAGDGPEIQAWAYLPEGEGPHPTLLNIHGGPVVQFGTGFFHEVQTFVAAGYAVIQANPRGSQGYGLEFVSAIARDWGRKPHDDLSAVLDVALAKFPLDSARLGVMGGSYGGYMTNWMIAHTDRFKAACTQRTVSQMEALIWGDFGCIWGHEIGSWPWEDLEHYTDQSPISRADKMNTPLLILQGLGDQRTPADQGERLFVTLRVLGKDVEMVLFPGADHNLSRGGKPEQRVERLRVIHEWFAERL